MSEVTLQNLDKSLPLVLNYERLVMAVNESIAHGLGYLAIKAEKKDADKTSREKRAKTSKNLSQDQIDKVISQHKVEIGEHFDDEICSLLGALSITRSHITIEAEITDGLGPDHVFPWKKKAEETLKSMGGDRKLEIIRKPAVITKPESQPLPIEAALAA